MYKGFPNYWKPLFSIALAKLDFFSCVIEVSFNNLKIISHTLAIRFNDELQTICGFDKLHSLGFDQSNTSGGYFTIAANDKLNRIEGFELLKEIKGNCLFNFNTPNLVTHLFNNLETVTGTLTTNLSHFQNLDSIGKLYIQYNLDTLTGFPKLVYAGTIEIENSNLRQIINTFPVLEKVENIDISHNPFLTSISGFPKLIQIDGMLSIEDNLLLDSINIFHQLSTIDGSFILNQNHKLNKLSGFDSLTWITKELSIEKIIA